MALTDQNILDLYNTYAEGRQQDAIAGSKAAGNPWAINIINQYHDIYGRMPTATEISAAEPAFQAGDAQGNAFVAQQKQLEDNSPDKLYQKQQQEYAKNAPQHFDAVNQLFQSSLGRQANQDELNHFGSLLASGTVDPYQLQQFIQQQPEYQQTQDKNFRTGLQSDLASSNQKYFQSNILPSIQEAYAKQGRSFDSSGFQNAATQSAQQQNQGMDQFIAQLSASQYGNQQQNAYDAYQNLLQNQQGLTNSGINAQYGAIQNSQNRANQYSDFSVQQNAYNQYLAKYGKRDNGLGGLLGGVLGAGVGAYASKSPQGAMAGYGVGSGLGTGAQNYFGGSY